MNKNNIDIINLNLTELRKRDEIYNQSLEFSEFNMLCKMIKYYPSEINNDSISNKMNNLSLFIFKDKPNNSKKENKIEVEEIKTIEHKNESFNMKKSSSISEKNDKLNSFQLLTNEVSINKENRSLEDNKLTEIGNTNNKINIEKFINPLTLDIKEIKIPEQTNINIKSENIKPIEIKSKYKDNLLSASNKYWDNIKDVIKNIFEDKKYSASTEKILTEVNTIIGQLSQDDDLLRLTDKTKKVLKELINDYNLYLFAIDYILKRLIIKSEKYKDESKTNFILFAKYISILSKNNKVILNFFFHIICYKCPYLIPKLYTDKDFSDKKVLRNRLGFGDTSTEEEKITSFINNMECYSLLYFYFLMENRYDDIILEYLNEFLTVKIEIPISSVFKNFLFVTGARIKQLQGMNVLSEVFNRIIKVLEEMKNSQKNVDLKSILNANIRFIKKYYQNLKDNKNIDS